MMSSQMIYHMSPFIATCHIESWSYKYECLGAELYPQMTPADLYVNHSEAKPDFNTKSAMRENCRRILITSSIFSFRA